jgi:hypothetical protein
MIHSSVLSYITKLIRWSKEIKIVTCLDSLQAAHSAVASGMLDLTYKTIIVTMKVRGKNFGESDFDAFISLPLKLRAPYALMYRSSLEACHILLLFPPYVLP